MNGWFIFIAVFGTAWWMNKVLDKLDVIIKYISMTERERHEFGLSVDEPELYEEIQIGKYLDKNN